MRGRLNGLRRPVRLAWWTLPALATTFGLSCGSDQRPDEERGTGVAGASGPPVREVPAAYHVSDALTAANPSHGLAIRFEETAVRVQTPSAAKLALTTTGYGCEGRSLEAVEPVQPRSVPGSRSAITYARRTVSGRALSEWFLNEPRGLEHGYDLPESLGCSGETVLRVRFEGFRASLAGGGRWVRLSRQGDGALRYTDLVVRDADGRELASRFVVSEQAVEIRFDDRDARYPVVVDPYLVTEQAKLLASDGATDDQFGASVTLEGDTAIVGAPYHGIGGAAYVFTRLGYTWSEQAKLVPDELEADDHFGFSVALHQDTAVIGARWDGGAYSKAGAAYVFVRDGTTWSQQAKLVAADGGTADWFGSAVAVDGDTAAVLLPRGQFSSAVQGAVYIFHRSGSSWSQQGKLLPNQCALFPAGSAKPSLSIDNDTVVVGGNGACVFVRNGGNWTEQASLPGAADAVAVLGDTILVGEDDAEEGGIASGVVRVYTRSGTTWSEETKLLANDRLAGDGLGASVSLAGEIALVGATGVSGPGYAAGSAYVFAKRGGIWRQEAKLTRGDPATGDRFGWSVGHDGDTALVGSPQDDDSGSESGSAYAFVLSGLEGVPCSSGAECGSGNCVEGVCCDTACDGVCESCLATVKGYGLDGYCEPLAAGTDPQDECTDDGSPSCQQNGLCGGNAACQLYPTASGCTPRPCTTGAECSTGHCVEGICCSSACTGLCQACTASGKGQGEDGLCGPIVAGTDPDDECLDSGSPTCQQNGLCDGAGACQTYPVSSGCTPEPCTSDAQCASTHCVDGFCCDTACNELCKACSNHLKGGGLDGVCDFVADGRDLQAECPAMGEGACQADGVCNGLGGCRATSIGQVCAAGTCSGNYAQANPDICDGDGICVDMGTSDCGTYVCENGACLTSCIDASDCNPAYECLGNKCGTGKDNGETCSQDTECSSLNCVESVCCNTACSGPCVSCLADLKATGQNDGTCGPISGGTDPKDLCADSGTECGADGMCDGLGDCRAFAPPTTSCQGGTSCVSAVTAAGMFCDGSGVCEAGQEKACTPYVCDQSSGSCRLSCSETDHCAPGYYCRSGECAPKKPNGQSCTVDDECSFGNCVEDVCCDLPCTAGCMSCRAANKESGAEGVCGPVTGGTDPLDACTPDGSDCGPDGLCDGTGNCRAYAPASKACEGGTVCSGPTEVSGKLCDGQGSCVTSSGTSCLPYICWTATGLCLASCVDESQCGPDSYCKNGACVDKAVNGVSCTDDVQCESGNCAEKVCCDDTCAEPCRSCIGNRTGNSDGVCDNVLADLVDIACPVSTDLCKEDGTCNGSGQCNVVAKAGKACGPTACDGDSLVTKSCDGFGICETETSACSPYGCNEVTLACYPGCTEHDACAEGFYCDGTGCVDAFVNGEACDEDAKCLSGFCVDGMCCDDACDQSCYSCAQSATGEADGACRPVLSGGADPQDACMPDGTDCGADGLCDGQGACRLFASAGTSCGDDACDAASVVGYECSGDGACETITRKSCEPYACDAQSADCLSSCTSNDDCSGGAQCNPDTGECGGASAVCKDAYTVANPDGSETSCRPYKCQAGVCRESCDTSNDCAEGYDCQGGKCLPEATGDAGTDGNPSSSGETDLESEKGCGCRHAGAPSGKGWATLIAIALVALGRRRRSSHDRMRER